MLEATIRNLIVNAIKFTDKGGKILVSAQETEKGDTQIVIKDTGIGMSEDTIERLFKIDHVECRQGTNGEPSTGLGLILCKDFVTKHGGEIWAESVENMGSTFFVTFPPPQING
jgi:signal transduction histidine kinase